MTPARPTGAGKNEGHSDRLSQKLRPSLTSRGPCNFQKVETCQLPLWVDLSSAQESGPELG